VTEEYPAENPHLKFAEGALDTCNIVCYSLSVDFFMCFNLDLTLRKYND